MLQLKGSTEQYIAQTPPTKTTYLVFLKLNVNICTFLFQSAFHYRELVHSGLCITEIPILALIRIWILLVNLYWIWSITLGYLHVREKKWHEYVYNYRITPNLGYHNTNHGSISWPIVCFKFSWQYRSYLYRWPPRY